MKLKLSGMVVYKKDKIEGGMLFSLADNSDALLKMTGIVDVIAEKLSNGAKIEDIRSSILAEYNVSEERLDADLEIFMNQLETLKFLE